MSETWHTNPWCLAAWPETVDGEYNPSCCRFPKSCSSLDPGPAPICAGCTTHATRHADWCSERDTPSATQAIQHHWESGG